MKDGADITDASVNDGLSGIAKPRPRGARLSRNLAILAAVFTFAVGLFITTIEGPYYSKNRTDPSYAYLFNALDVEQGITPFLIQHPGTTVHVIGAVVMRASWWMESLVSSSDTSLVASVLTEPEGYLHAINLALLLLMAATIGVATKRIYDLTGQTALSLIVPSLLLFSSSVLESTGQVQPEPLIVTLGIAATLLAVPRADQSSAHMYLRATLFGFTLGAGMITKATFAPLALLILVFPGLSAMLLAGFAMVIAMSILTLPIWPKLILTYGWLKDVMTHQGYYGAGAEGIPPLRQDLVSALELIVSEPLILVGISVTAVGAYAVRYRGAASANPIWCRFYLAAAALSVTQLVIVAKHPFPRYLMPALVSAAIFIPLALNHMRGRIAIDARVLRGAIAILFIAATYTNVRQYLKDRTDRKETAEVAAIAADIDCRIIPYYRSSNLNYALKFGEYWSGDNFEKQLALLYPELVSFDPATGLFETFGSTFSDPASHMGERRWCLMGDFTRKALKYPNAEIDFEKEIGENLLIVIKPPPRTR